MSIEAITVFVNSIEQTVHLSGTHQSATSDLLWVLEGESHLRRKAYAHVQITKGEVFFNNSDLNSGYFILLVYSSEDRTPLLSARYYFDPIKLKSSLKFDALEEPSKTDLELLFLLHHKLNQNKLFLIDRMSANAGHPLYRRHRNTVLSAMHYELFLHTRDCLYIGLARKEPLDKLKLKYQQFGMKAIGTITHQDKLHWVLKGNMEESYRLLKSSIATNLGIHITDMPEERPW
ncbi:MAG: hypothetical protein A3D92_03530 [Bacteroidetes bacterium RIFCSPHIGHO2_02_FULL_44_7]|nr:MAG: hypothetical protein A3D92_03530 [Bacteroidetes bacterium RIFCSPHIGHO2_02_FULL_44_7]